MGLFARAGLLALVLLALAGAVAPGDPAARVSACSPGPHAVVIKGHSVLRFCGPARATVRIGRRTIRFSGGVCNGATMFTLQIGTAAGPGYRGPPVSFFSITAYGARPGRRTSAAIAIVSRGRSYLLARNTVRFAAGLHRGTLTGRVYRTGQAVSGSFSC